jgi:type II secretory pathway component PulF
VVLDVVKQWLPGAAVVELSGKGGAATLPERQQLARSRVASKHVALVTRQLAALLQGGVPLVQALQVVAVQPEAPQFGLILQDVAAQVASGLRLSAALHPYPRVFGKLFVTMIQVGESSGQIDSSLLQLSEWLERDQALKQKITSSLSYPGFVFVLAVTLTVVLFSTILPGFVSIFEEMQAPLPLVTQLVVLLTKMVKSPLCWAAVLAAGVFGAYTLQAITRDPARYAALYRTLVNVPLIGPLFWHGSAARYCAAMEVLLSAGMDMRRTLQLAGSASGSPLLENDADALVQAVLDGGQVSSHMAEHPETYSSTILHMTVAGEEASRLPEMFQRAAYFHELEMQGKIQALSVALEPLLLAGVSVVVGTILIAIFLPLYGILTTLGS